MAYLDLMQQVMTAESKRKKQCGVVLDDSAQSQAAGLPASPLCTSFNQVDSTRVCDPQKTGTEFRECMTSLVVQAIQAISAVSHVRAMTQLLTNFLVPFPQ
jgi:hypothetical protein